jgi:hypothetical protein
MLSLSSRPLPHKYSTTLPTTTVAAAGSYKAFRVYAPHLSLSLPVTVQPLQTSRSVTTQLLSRTCAVPRTTVPGSTANSPPLEPVSLHRYLCGTQQHFTKLQAVLGEANEMDAYNFPDARLKKQLDDPSKTPLLLVACGSFSPITFLHLRMFVMAGDYVKHNTTFEVVGGYLSPVSDAYRKQGLAPAEHR